MKSVGIPLNLAGNRNPSKSSASKKGSPGFRSIAILQFPPINRWSDGVRTGRPPYRGLPILDTAEFQSAPHVELRSGLGFAFTRWSCASPKWGVALAIFLLTAVNLNAQRDPRIGYVYPAGGRQGSTVDVSVGGQFLDGAARVYFSGTGVDAEVIGHDKPPAQRVINGIRQKLQEVQKQVREMRQNGEWRNQNARETILKLADEKELSIDDLQLFAEYQRRQSDPKRQLNPQIAEKVHLKITVASDAPIGPRELRIETRSGLSNPLKFCVGHLKEVSEPKPVTNVAWENLVGLRTFGRRRNEPEHGIQTIQPPVVVNGQIQPGEIDAFQFVGKQGQRLVVSAKARALIPYLADAVPGWFQAVVAIHDAQGNEVAYADDYRFDPDPVLACDIPADGDYTVKIRDALYRGREDFVYRLTLGELPFVTHVFPLGCQIGEPAEVAVSGWNLPDDVRTLRFEANAPGSRALFSSGEDFVSNPIVFRVDTLPETVEREPNDQRAAAPLLTLPTIVNGRIEPCGDVDLFRFEGREGDRIIAEITARRLNSPLDSVLALLDATGRPLARNDDCSDPCSGLITHHADSQVLVILPTDGIYSVQVADVQNRGGPAFAYRLRISAPRPDFELRVTPSIINARPGVTLPLDLYAMRNDGFEGDIMLRLASAPVGYKLGGGWVPSGQDSVRITLTVPGRPSGVLVPIHLEGYAAINGETVVRGAIPAENMMQAFFYTHLVPFAELLVNVKGVGRRGEQVTLVLDKPARIPAGGSAAVELHTGNVNLADQFQFELDSPPDGIRIQDIAANGDRLRIVFESRSESVKPGLKGNLILAAYQVARSRPGTNRRANPRRAPAGVLPAIPFEIISP